MSNNNEKKYEKFDSFEGFFQQAEDRLSYWVERAKLEFTEEVVTRMQELGVTKTELAERAALETIDELQSQLAAERANTQQAVSKATEPLIRALQAMYDCKYKAVSKTFPTQAEIDGRIATAKLLAEAALAPYSPKKEEA